MNTIYVKEVIPEVVERAKDDAGKNLPAPETKSSIHTDFLTTRFNRMVVDYKSAVENSQQQYHANKDIMQFKKLMRRLKDKLNGVVNDLRISKRANENLKSSETEMKNYQKALVGILLLTGSEAIFASSSFQMFVSNLLFALVIGGAFAVCLYYSATIGAKILKLAKTRFQFAGIFSVILLIIGTVFYILGYYRVVFHQQMTDDIGTGYELSPLQFMIIQTFFYSCAILLKYFYLPEKEVFEQHNKWKKAHQNIGRLEKEKVQLEASIDDMEKSLNRSLITRRSLVGHSAEVELKIDALYRDSYQHYIKNNLHFRTDNQIPECFKIKNNIPDLTLFFQDSSLLEFDEADLSDV